MKNACSILGRARPLDVKLEPFPHLVIREALPERYYRELEECYPSDELVVANDRRGSIELGTAAPNERYQISAAEALDGELLAPIWSDFVAYHTSDEFYRELLGVFGEAIRSTYPDLEARMERSLEDCRIGVRRRDDATSDVVLDCQVGINTAPIERGRTLGPHLDNPVELFAGLLYVPHPDDDSTGGALQLQTWRSETRRHRGKLRIEDALVETFATVSYEPNTFALFLNSPVSVHAVTPRSVTPMSRRLVNIIGEVYPILPSGLFSREDVGARKSRSLLSRGGDLLRSLIRAAS